MGYASNFCTLDAVNICKVADVLRNI